VLPVELLGEVDELGELELLEPEEPDEPDELGEVELLPMLDPEPDEPDEPELDPPAPIEPVPAPLELPDAPELGLPAPSEPPRLQAVRDRAAAAIRASAVPCVNLDAFILGTPWLDCVWRERENGSPRCLNSL
jgi:hypothetical protein